MLVLVDLGLAAASGWRASGPLEVPLASISLSERAGDHPRVQHRVRSTYKARRGMELVRVLGVGRKKKLGFWDLLISPRGVGTLAARGRWLRPTVHRTCAASTGRVQRMTSPSPSLGPARTTSSIPSWIIARGEARPTAAASPRCRMVQVQGLQQPFAGALCYLVQEAVGGVKGATMAAVGRSHSDALMAYSS